MLSPPDICPGKGIGHPKAVRDMNGGIEHTIVVLGRGGTCLVFFYREASLFMGGGREITGGMNHWG